MNKKLLKKIQLISKDLHGQITKNGKGFNHSYFTSEDVIPNVLDKCIQYEVGYKPYFEHGMAKMEVVDTAEDGSDESLVYTLPFIVNDCGSATKNLQNTGKMQTYIKRYLLMQIFDICDVDAVELEDPNKSHHQSRKPYLQKRTEDMCEKELEEMVKKVENICQRNNACVDFVLNEMLDSSKITKNDYERLTNFFEKSGGVTM